MSRIAVCGAGGFIGGHLTKKLAHDGHMVLAVDKKPVDDWYQVTEGTYVLDSHDLSLKPNADSALMGAEQVYMLAADMGGMGFIENNKLDCMLSVLTSTHTLDAASRLGVDRFFYSSSACVYAADKQTETSVTALKESDAYPAQAEDGYGWEKLFTERMAKHFRDETGLITRVARYHNVYGPYGTFEGGREKAPAAIIRKVIHAKLTNDMRISIWGDGEQTRSFMDIEDCIKGTIMIMNSDHEDPINLGSSELVSINQLVTIAEDIAEVKLSRRYDLTAPQGVRGRNSDNTLIKEKFNWEPSIALQDGMEKLYKWVYDEIRDRYV